jgi:hypothetical protein
MTVISALYFNKKGGSGAVVADEQSSTYGRKYDITTKVQTISIPDYDQPEGTEIPKICAIIGGTGSTDVLNEIAERSAEAIAADKRNIARKEDLVARIGRIMGEVRGEFVNSFLYAQFRLSEVDFQTGHRTLPDGTRVPLTRQLLAEYDSIARNPNGPLSMAINNQFLILGIDHNGAQLYNVHNNLLKPVRVKAPYDTVGSGSDLADPALYRFYKKIDREGRTDIDPVEGISALLNATIEADMNHGVGGTPMITAIDNGKIYTPDSNRSRLAMELLIGVREGYLAKAFAHDSIGGLVFGDATFDATEDEMFRQATNAKDLSRILRKYTV